MKKVLVISVGVLVFFASIWIGALLFNKLPTEYESASLATGVFGCILGWVMAMFGFLEMK